MDFKNFFYAFVFLLYSTSYLYAQEFVQKTDSTGHYKLSDIVVTATRTNASMLELANSISIIDSVDIANRNKTNVFELLKTEYGLSSIQFGPGGGLSTINIRGADVGHTLILVDGIEMNLTSESSNLYDFANLPVNGINRIEVLRGPQSTLYGSDAMAGVVNIITKKGSGAPAVTLSGEGGSFKSFKGAMGFSGNYKNLNYNLTFGRTQTAGFSAAGKKYGNTENDGYRANNFSSRIGYNFNNFSGVDVFFRFIKAETDLDQGGGQFKDDPTYKYNLEETGVRVQSFTNLLGGFWEINLGGSYIRNVRKYNYDPTLFNPISSNSFYDGRRYKLDWQNNFNFNPDNVITLGVETEKEQALTTYYSLSSYGPYESILPTSEVYTSGIYLQDQLKFNKSFFTTAGIRYDHHNKFGGAFTYRVAPAYIFWQTGTKIKATVGTSYKAPSIFYLFDQFFGNEDLQPEKSLGWDIGIEQYFFSDQITAGLTYFNNDYKDLIGLDENFQSFNINKARTNGVEFFFSTNPSKNLLLKASYTYTNTKDNSVNSTDFGRQLLRRPKIKIVYLLNYSVNAKTNFNLETIYVSSRDDKDFSYYPASRTRLNAYTLVNLSARYNLFDFFRIFIRIENVFDVKYEEVFGYGTPGLSVFSGLKINIL
jgi:vitamin B12 transporter